MVRYITIIAIVLLLSLAHFNVAESQPPDGGVLYGKHCAACHGSLEVTSKRGVSADAIRKAMDKNRKMKALKFLTYEDLTAIALVLSQ